MAMTRKNFLDARPAIKGAYGEYFVQKRFWNAGYVIYRPEGNKPHGFDRFLYKDGKYCALEVKTKPMCDKYPETGIDQRHYERYLKLSEKHNMPVLLVFVDENKKKIYGNYLSELAKPKYIKELGQKGHYPKPMPSRDGKDMLVYFHESSMLPFWALSDDEVERLKSFSRS